MEAFSLAELVLVAHCSELISTEKKSDNDEISSQISAQIFEFCDNELFPETTTTTTTATLQNSEEVTSCSNYCYDQELSLPQDTNTTTNTTTTTTANGNIPIMFESQEDIDNEISASIDFSVPLILGAGPTTTTTAAQHEQFDFASALPQIPMVDPGYPISSVFEDGCLPQYLPLNPSSPSCSFLGPASMGPYLPPLPTDASGLFATTLLMASEFQPQDLDFQPDFCSDSMQRVFNAGELQALGCESQQLIGGAGNSTSLASDISNMGDQTFKVGKLSVEQRKEKIHRYMKKRNERNFSKKIKYACRKTLADSRPRVRGRFAKNDDFGENPRAASSNHEEDDEEEVVVKEEDDMVDSSDIFAHISGVNSFKCNYPIQSWI